jgi:hypothetical protein
MKDGKVLTKVQGTSIVASSDLISVVKENVGIVAIITAVNVAAVVEG